ncbi:hypothetical protein KEM54_004707 [Ascosphaera aggregata]|nr:hypothetical protein KEM54_004707 [Ascosphaera aggregata]
MKSPKHPSRVILSGAKGTKAAPTASTSKTIAVPVSSLSPSALGSTKVNVQGHSRSRSSSSRMHRYDKSGGGPVLLDATTDRATTALIYRVLCSHMQLNASNGASISPKPLDQLLPPLTSSNKIDLQLYALLAIIVKEYINPWYSRITPDHTLTDEIVKLFAHCTRAVEQRLRRVDIDALLLNDLPALVESHIHGFHIATETSASGPNSVRFRAVYHTLNPHPALDPVPDPTNPSSVATQEEKEGTYRHLLSQAVLAVLLPTEDLKNVCLRTILEDILADLLLGEVVSKKICDKSSIWEYLTKVLHLLQDHSGKGKGKVHKGKAGASNATATVATANSKSSKSQLEKFGLLGRPDLSENGAASDAVPNRRDFLASKRAAFSAFMWTVLQCLYLIFITVRFAVTGLYKIYSTPEQIQRRQLKDVSRPVTPNDAGSSTASAASTMVIDGGNSSQKPPFLSYHIFSMVSSLFKVNQRMPWLESTGALFQHILLYGPGQMGKAGGILDRFCHETIQNHVLTPDLVPIMLLATRAALFPGNRRQVANLAVSHVSRHATHSNSSSSGSAAGPPPAMSTLGGVKKGSNSNSSQGSTIPKPTAVPGPPDEPSEIRTRATRRACAAAFLEVVPAKLALSFFCPKAGGNKQKLANSPLQPPSSSNHDTAVRAARYLPSPLSRANQLSAAQGFEAATSTVPQDDEWLLQTIEESLLGIFSDSYCNKHLVFSAAESLLTSLFPELSEKCVSELMSERGF